MRGAGLVSQHLTFWFAIIEGRLILFGDRPSEPITYDVGGKVPKVKKEEMVVVPIEMVQKEGYMLCGTVEKPMVLGGIQMDGMLIFGRMIQSPILVNG